VLKETSSLLNWETRARSGEKSLFFRVLAEKGGRKRRALTTAAGKKVGRKFLRGERRGEEAQRMTKKERHTFLHQLEKRVSPSTSRNGECVSKSRIPERWPLNKWAEGASSCGRRNSSSWHREENILSGLSPSQTTPALAGSAR